MLTRVFEVSKTTILMSFTGLSSFPFKLALAVVSIHMLRQLYLPVTVIMTVCVMWQTRVCTWLTRFKLMYLLRSCLLALFLLNLFKLTSLRLDFVELPLVALSAVMLVVRVFWDNPTEIKRKSMPSSRGRVRKMGDPDDMPPVFPNGWIPVAQSSLVPKEGIISVTVLGQKLCVFRGGESGRVFVLDAYCPHLGADLTEQGRVRGDCVECPFHGWRFRGQDGLCTHIPYAKSVPSVAKAQTWQCVERNGFVFVWHHAEGEEPTWHIPSVPQVESGEWKYRGKTEHLVHCHIQEIPENGADVAHLHQLHSRSVFERGSWMEGSWFSSWLTNLMRHEWSPDWRPEAHVGRIALKQHIRLGGCLVPFLTVDMDIQQIGPAAVQMHLNTRFGRGVFLQHVIPEGPLTMRVVHLLYTANLFFPLVATLLLHGEAYMFDRDVAVWNHKKLLRKPVLVREDHLVVQYRRWYAQFYSDSSPTLRDIMDRSLEW